MYGSSLDVLGFYLNTLCCTSSTLQHLGCQTGTDNESRVTFYIILACFLLHIETGSWPARSVPPLSCNRIQHMKVPVTHYKASNQIKQTIFLVSTEQAKLPGGFFLQFFPMLTGAWRLLQSIPPGNGSVLGLWSSWFFVFLIKHITTKTLCG